MRKWEPVDGDARVRHRGFTLVELLVVIAITAMLIALLMPSLQQAREMAITTKCASNQRGLAVAFQQYAGDERYRLPISAHSQTLAGAVTYGMTDWYRIYRHYILPANQLGTSMDSQRNIYALGSAAPIFNCPGVNQNKSQVGFFGPTQGGSWGLWIGTPRPNTFNYVFNNLNVSIGINATKYKTMDDIPDNQIVIIDKNPICNWMTANSPAAGTGAADCKPAGMGGAYWNMFWGAGTPSTGTYSAGTHHLNGANILYRGGDVRWQPAKKYYTSWPLYSTVTDRVDKN